MIWICNKCTVECRLDVYLPKNPEGPEPTNCPWDRIPLWTAIHDPRFKHDMEESEDVTS